MRFKDMKSRCYIPASLSSSVTLMPGSDSAIPESSSAGIPASFSSASSSSSSAASSSGSSASLSSAFSAVALFGTACWGGLLSTFLSLTALLSSVAEV